MRQQIEFKRSEIFINRGKTLSKQEKKRLRDLDKNLELVYNSKYREWELYNVIFYGATPSDDRLIFQHCGDSVKAVLDRAEKALWKNTNGQSLGARGTRKKFREVLFEHRLMDNIMLRTPVKQVSEELQYWTDWYLVKRKVSSSGALRR